MLFQDLKLVTKNLRGTERVPDIRVLGDHFQVHLLARRADQDGRIWLSNGFGFAPRILNGVVLPADARLLLCPEAFDDLQGLVEPANAFGGGIKRDPIGRVFLLEPAGADSEDEPASGSVIQSHSHFGEKCRVAICIARYEQANFDSARLHCQSRQANPSFKARSGWIAENGKEMIKCECGVVAGLVNRFPSRYEILP